jgi:O-antigen/teichoic acid export membrane protein
MLSGIFMLINAGAYFLLPYTHNREIIMCIKWGGITYLSTVTLDIVAWRLQADQKYMTMLLYRMINSISTIFSFIMLVVVHKMTLENALLYNFLVNCMVSVLGICLNMSGIRYIFRRTKETVSEIMHYGKYMLGTTSISSLLGNSDNWAANIMLGPAGVAVYNLAVRFMAVIDLPLRSFNTTGLSEMAVSYNKNDLHQVTFIFKKYAGMLTVAFIPIVIAALLFADIPIYMIGGAKYSHSIAANSYRLFMLVALLSPMDRFIGLALDVTRKTKINFYKVILMLLIRVLVNFAAIAFFGNIYGINLSCFIVTVFAIAFGHYQLRKKLDYKISEILTLGYSEMKLLVQDKLKLSRVGNKR